MSSKVSAGTLTVASTIGILLGLYCWSPNLFLAIFICLVVCFTIIFVYLIVYTTTSDADRTLSYRKRPPLKFTRPEQWAQEVAKFSARTEPDYRLLVPESDSVSAALDSLVQLIMRDFIHSWYVVISHSDMDFPFDVLQVFYHAIQEAVARLECISLADFIVKKVLPIFTEHLDEFSKADALVNGKHRERTLTESPEVDIAVAMHYNGGHLHPAAGLNAPDVRQAQLEWLRPVVDDINSIFLPQSERDAKPVSILVREILSCSVMYPVMDMLADPDWWNRLIVSVAGPALNDQRSVRRLRNALDAQSRESTPSSSSTNGLMNDVPHLVKKPARLVLFNRQATDKEFSAFMKSIKMLTSISELRRLKNDIYVQLNGNPISPLHRSRLLAANKVISSKLSSGPDNATNNKSNNNIDNSYPSDASLASSNQGSASGHPDYSLADILGNPSGTSYFIEFMDRKRAAVLVQFWLVVNGLRNPLETSRGATDDNEGNDIVISESTRADIAFIYRNYFDKSMLKIPDSTKVAVAEFLAKGVKADKNEYIKAKRNLLHAQEEVYQRMNEEYLPSFKKSELYLRFLSSMETSNNSSKFLQTSGAASGGNSLKKDGDVDALQNEDLGDREVRPEPVSPARHKKTESLTDLRHRMSYHGPRQLFSAVEKADKNDKADEVDGVTDNKAPNRKTMEAVEEALNDIVSSNRTRSSADISRDRPYTPVESLKKSDSMVGLPNADTSGNKKPVNGATSGDVVSTSGDNAEDLKSFLFGSNADQDLFRSAGPIFGDEGSASGTDESSSDEDSSMTTTKSQKGDQTGGNNWEEGDDSSSEDDDQDEEDFPVEIRSAAPGDLGLKEAIAKLNKEINRLQKQQEIVNALLDKAELTNNIAELRILKKSSHSLDREIRQRELQRQRYLVQESESKLYGKSRVSIPQVTTSKGHEGHEYSVYLIEIQKLDADGNVTSGWMVARRYRQFLALHRRLRRKIPEVSKISFPRKRMVMKLQRTFVDNRRIALQSYLQNLLKIPAACQSYELRAFLSSQSPDVSDLLAITAPGDPAVRIFAGTHHHHRGVKWGSSAAAAGENPTTLTGDTATVKPVLPARMGPPGAFNSTLSFETESPDSLQTIADAQREQQVFATTSNLAQKPSSEDKKHKAFIDPICDFFVEFFFLNRTHNWFRGRAVVIVLQQLLGGTIEKKFREEVSQLLTTEGSIVWMIEYLKNSLWPNGGQFRPPDPQTPEAKREAQVSAIFMLECLLQDFAGNLLGRSNVTQATRRVCRALQNPILNRHLAYSVLDLILRELLSITSAHGNDNSSTGTSGTHEIKTTAT